ncbi:GLYCOSYLTRANSFERASE [Salix purpurea]|uniref:GLYCOSYLTRANSFERASE n=1 Tax=Salix purpurea TaxID=77065 RepID=A0A9Q0VXM4_SALPP|nr:GLYCOSYLTRANSFERASE [Salix purpurea]
MKKAEVVLIPLPAMGHIVAVMEIAKLLVRRDDRLYTTVLVMHPTLDPSTTRYNELHAASTLPDRMRVINLPRVESITSATKVSNWIAYLIEGHKPF